MTCKTILTLIFCCFFVYPAAANKTAKIEIKVLAHVEGIYKEVKTQDSVVYRGPLIVSNMKIDTVPASGIMNFEPVDVTDVTIGTSVNVPEKGIIKELAVLNKFDYSPETYDSTIMDLDFGSFYSGNKPGVIAVSDIQVVQVGGVKKYDGSGNAAYVYIQNEPNLRFSLDFPDSLIIKSKDGKNSMKVKYITPQLDNYKLNTDGIKDFYLTGLLEVAENQQPGDYEGSFIMTIEIREPKVIYKTN